VIAIAAVRPFRFCQRVPALQYRSHDRRTHAGKEGIRHRGAILNRPRSNFHVLGATPPSLRLRIRRAAAVVASVDVVVVVVVGPVDHSPPPLGKTRPRRRGRVPQRQNELLSSGTKPRSQRRGHAGVIEGAQSPSVDGDEEASATDAGGGGEAGGAADEGEVSAGGPFDAGEGSAGEEEGGEGAAAVVKFEEEGFFGAEVGGDGGVARVVVVVVGVVIVGVDIALVVRVLAVFSVHVALSIFPIPILDTLIVCLATRPTPSPIPSTRTISTNPSPAQQPLTPTELVTPKPLQRLVTRLPQHPQSVHLDQHGSRPDSRSEGFGIGPHRSDVQSQREAGDGHAQFGGWRWDLDVRFFFLR